MLIARPKRSDRGRTALTRFESAQNAHMLLPIHRRFTPNASVQSLDQRFVPVKPPEIETENNDLGRVLSGQLPRIFIEIAQILDHSTRIEKLIAPHPEH